MNGKSGGNETVRSLLPVLYDKEPGVRTCPGCKEITNLYILGMGRTPLCEACLVDVLLSDYSSFQGVYSVKKDEITGKQRTL